MVSKPEPWRWRGRDPDQSPWRDHPEDITDWRCVEVAGGWLWQLARSVPFLNGAMTLVWSDPVFVPDKEVP